MKNILKSKVIIYILYSILIIIYSLVGYYSNGYEDEFFNIDLIQNHSGKFIEFIQKNDVHPPASYIIDAVLIKIFKNWQIVRFIISLVNSILIIYLINWTKKKYGIVPSLILYISYGLNPAILMWCTSIRWYSFFIPILAWTIATPDFRDFRYWIKWILGVTILGYFGYAIFVIIIPLTIIYWNNYFGSFRKKIIALFISIIIFICLYSYQLYFFFKYHYINKDVQTYSIIKNLIGYYSAQISNQGVFPISIAGFISAISTIGLYFFAFKSKSNKYSISFYISILITFFLGIAGKIRNLVILTTFQGLWISTSNFDIKNKKIINILLLGLLISNILGIVNVIKREDTIKSNYNLQIKPLIILLNQKRKLNENTIIFCHSRTISWNLENNGFLVIDPFSPRSNKIIIREKSNLDIIVIKTWQGSIDDFYFYQLYRNVRELKYKYVKKYKFNRDAYFKYKKYIDNRYPEYGIEVSEFSQVENINVLKSWFKNNSSIQ